MDLFWFFLMMFAFIGNMLLISTPFFFIHWFENHLKMWILIILSGCSYLMTFAFSLYILSKLVSIMPKENELLFNSLMLTLLFAIQSIPLLIGYSLFKRKNNSKTTLVLNE